MNAVMQYVLYLGLLVASAILLGRYISRAMNGERVFLSRMLEPCENGVYKILRVDKNEDMNWKKYAKCALVFNAEGLVVLFLILVLQRFLPLNPEHIPGNSWHLAFNTAVSFVPNTNWQAYSGESALSHFSQAMGLTVQNFVSAACGIAVLFAMIRGFVRVKAQGIGSFWVDLTRAVIYVMYGRGRTRPSAAKFEAGRTAWRQDRHGIRRRHRPADRRIRKGERHDEDRAGMHRPPRSADFKKKPHRHADGHCSESGCLYHTGQPGGNRTPAKAVDIFRRLLSVS